MSRRILVCDSQRPFGGDDPAGAVTERLVEELRGRDLVVDLARVPTMPENPAGPLIWRLLDVASSAEGADLLLATRFPSYLARHPNKVVWLLEDAAEAAGPRTETEIEPDDRRRELDRRVLGEARRLFAGTGATARALYSRAGLDAVVLPVPEIGSPSEGWDRAVAELTSTL